MTPAVTTSENIIKLRKLTNDICELESSNDYERVLKTLKEIINEGEHQMIKSSTSQNKIKCYETMCAKITKILNNVNF